MEKRKDYTSSEHKIHMNWDDISKLIALEEELIKRIESLEGMVNRLWKLVADKTKG